MQNKLFNESLTTRFNTLERNIKSKSNSFYDSYLDLLEATIKYFLDENNIIYDDSRTCGYLVKEESIKNFLMNWPAFQIGSVRNRCFDKLILAHEAYVDARLPSIYRDLAGIVTASVSYTHLRAHETVLDLVCRLLLEKKQKTTHIY